MRVAGILWHVKKDMATTHMQYDDKYTVQLLTSICIKHKIKHHVHKANIQVIYSKQVVKIININTTSHVALLLQQ